MVLIIILEKFAWFDLKIKTTKFMVEMIVRFSMGDRI